jgi:FAD/FMN-containing dehydrogenase
MVLTEADGSRDEATRLQAEVQDVLAEDALAIHAPSGRAAVEELWRWRDGVSIAVTARRGGKVSEDIVVPIEHLAAAIDRTSQIGERHGLTACSWGHAGDGNLHATFLVASDDEGELARAEDASEELFAMAAELGGSVSGEHGVGWVKRGQLARQWAPRALQVHAEIKRCFDPKGLLNPGKKLAS